jgi:general L-amino acid transport system substrate-binding protein
MWKRLAVLLAVLALIAAACGDDDDTPSGTEAPSGTDAPAGTTAAPAPPDVGQPSSGGTLQTVIDRGVLRCGVSGSLVGFSQTQPDGSQVGLDADYCRAVAAAVLGNADSVEFRALTAAERFDVLKAGDVDVLFRNTTFTQSRDSTGDVAIDFGPTTFYDGQALMGRRDKFGDNPTPAAIDGAIACTNAGTTTEKNITEWANLEGASIILETVENFNDALAKFEAGQCDFVTTDSSGLVANKVAAEQEGRIAVDEWVVFPRSSDGSAISPISKEPLGPAYRQNDSEWANIIDWVVYATFIAFEKGIDSTNIDSMRDSDPEATRLFGGEGEVQSTMGLSADAFYQVISQVGNYAEIYDNNLNPLGFARAGTLNDLFTRGGMIYAPPAR